MKKKNILSIFLASAILLANVPSLVANLKDGKITSSKSKSKITSKSKTPKEKPKETSKETPKETSKEKPQSCKLGFFSKIGNNVSNFFTNIYENAKIKATGIKNPKIRKYGKKVYNWTDRNVESVKQKWNNSNILEKAMYVSLAAASVIVSPYLFLKRKKVMGSLFYLTATGGLLYYIAKSTTFGKKIIDNSKKSLKTAQIKIKKQIKKDYSDICNWGKKAYNKLSFKK
ncbi:hypothetical protein ACFLYU_02935 [Candidatus Dependentiae bacterium]